VRFAGADSTSFCYQFPDASNPYVSAGGGDGNSDSWSGFGPCRSGQYSFTEQDGWKITVDNAMAEGKSPYRAFAYMQLCNGLPHSQCWMQDSISISFSFKTQGLSQIGTYLKLLFWTEASTIFGLLPPAHPKGGGKFRLIVFPGDNYPTSWKHEAEIEENKWFQLQIIFSPSTQAVAAYLDGAQLGDARIPVNMLEANNAPQIGVYSYASSDKAWPGGFALWLHDMCIGEVSGICRPDSNASLVVMAQPTPVPAPAPTTTTKRATTSTTTGCSKLCSRMNITAANQTWDCSSQQDQDSCEVGYITSGGLSVMCAWSPDRDCFADGTLVMHCPLPAMETLCGVTTTTEPEEEVVPITEEIRSTATVAAAAAASTGVAVFAIRGIL